MPMNGLLLADIQGQQNQGFLADHPLLVIALIALMLGCLVVLFVFFSFVQLWIRSFLTGAKIGIMDMVRMKLCKVDYTMIVSQKIALVQAGVKVSTQEMEAHYLSRGNVQRVAGAVIAAHKAAWICPGASPPPSIWPAATSTKP